MSKSSTAVCSQVERWNWDYTLFWLLLDTVCFLEIVADLSLLQDQLLGRAGQQLVDASMLLELLYNFPDAGLVFTEGAGNGRNRHQVQFSGVDDFQSPLVREHDGGLCFLYSFWIFAGFESRGGNSVPFEIRHREVNIQPREGLHSPLKITSVDFGLPRNNVSPVNGLAAFRLKSGPARPHGQGILWPFSIGHLAISNHSILIF